MTRTSTSRERWEDLEASVRKLRHDCIVFQMQQEMRDEPSPEVVVAGIEARAGQRAAMKRERKFIGEI